MQVVIVESAAKAKSINKYLGPGYKVLASFGHVRDLPAKDGSVLPDNDFSMEWEADPKATKILAEIVKAVRDADKLILATDPDREGEAISWHILEVLEKRRALKGIPVERVAFNAVTKQAVTEAMKHPREIDTPLVSAYLARRALDYLVGFTLSPVLWRKLPGSRSAGRVQSVALRLVCDREAEIEAFRTDEYWTIEALLRTAKGEEVKARLTAIAGTTLKKLDIKDEASALAIKAAIERGNFTVTSVERKATKRNPYPPFTTSTLQMDASRKLGFSAKQTMGVAQRLYEGVDVGGDAPVGLITYMRTDGVQIVPEAVGQIRDVISAEYGRNYTPFSREYKSKAKNAQEAHEAIRPTDPSRRPQDVARYLEKDQAALYELIWKRTIASQMAPADIEQTTVGIDVTGRDGKLYGLRATGSVIVFDGFLRVYEEGRDDRQRQIEKGKADEEADGDEGAARRLPALAKGETLKDDVISADQHFTQPPPRYTEATLVKRMEELGIGRPSTYASTMATLVDRDYVRIDRKRLVPEDKGRLVTAFLKSFFTRYVEYDFTAGLEEKLDLISDDKLAWKDVLREFWSEFTATVEGTRELRVTDVLEALNEILGPHVFPEKSDGGDPRKCPTCDDGRLSLKIGRFGAFIGCSNYPDCRFTRQFSQSDEEATQAQAGANRLLGQDPETGLDVTVRSGRFGHYIQLGEPETGERPKRASIPKGTDAGELTLERALALLSLPRLVGPHPETAQPIVAGYGRYGPFVECAGKYANLDSPEEVFTVGLNRAVTLLAEKAASGGRRGSSAAALRDLGEHPADGGKVEIMNGRYGPYVRHGKVNATIPRGKDPAALTMEEAVVLIAERAAKTASGSSGAKKPAKAAKAGGKAAKSDTKGADATGTTGDGGNANAATKPKRGGKATAGKAPAGKSTAGGKSATKRAAKNPADPA
ncbi:MAG: type I DNA topoisomerase [Rhizobiales bacterium]|nr:type I DNA topoisomerase [Hyphomicrobiales bacterium]